MKKYNISKKISSNIYSDTLASKIITLRINNKLSVKALSKLANVSEQTLRAIENKNVVPTPKIVHKVAKALNVCPIWLCNYDTLPDDNLFNKIYKLSCYFGCSIAKLGDYIGLNNYTLTDIYSKKSKPSQIYIQQFNKIYIEMISNYNKTR